MPEAVPHDASDIAETSWIDRSAPSALRPYLRLARMDRPIGTWLLLLPCWWGLSLASNSWPDPWYLLLFAFGSLVMRGAGCTVNDLADREFDARVARTAQRPIPSGEISVWQALAFLGLQLTLGLLVLMQFNTFSIVLGMSSLGLVAVYPFMKRITYWPQFFLGLTFNWGALMGWAVVHGDLAPAAVALYTAGIVWTLGYDTIYAHQDKEDDAIVGIKSTAIKFGDRTKPWLAAFYSLAIVLLGTAGRLADLYWPFYVVLGAAAVHLVWQIRTLDIDDPKNCLSRFKSNRHFGLVVLAGIVAGRVVA